MSCEIPRPPLFDLVPGQAAPGADVPLTKTRLFAYTRDAEVAGDQLRGTSCPDEVRRPDRRDRRELGQPRGSIFGLTLSEG
jgi:hypothetical protein